MNMIGDITLASVRPIIPELFLLGMALFLLVYGVYRQPRCNRFFVCVAMLVAIITALLITCAHGASVVAFNGMFVSNPFTVFAKLLVLASVVLVLLLSSQWLTQAGGRPSEFIILMLFSVLGMMVMISANNFLVLYMGLELSSLALYVLAAFERDHAKSNEAGLKYFVLGSLASGMLLFGISLVYGFAGSIGFDALAKHFTISGGFVTEGLVVGLVLVTIGFCFKVSAVPFHMWTPDVYEGAPTPVTAFFATAPKVAAAALFARVLLVPFGPLVHEWQQIIGFVSVASMLVGALAAIMQTNIKRLLAYSSVAHVGFILMGLAAANTAGVQAMLVYLALYIFMSAGAFGVVLMMRRGGHAGEEIKDLRGLGQTQPALALAIAIFMFSMAGIPPMSGFFGKFYVVLAAMDAGLVWLALAGVIISVAGCYYYIKIVKVMYFDEPAQTFDEAPLSLRMAVAVGAAVTFFFFLLPTPLVAYAKIAAEALFQ